MKIVMSPMCTNSVGSLSNYLLYGTFKEEIRQKYVPKFIVANPKVARLAGNELALMISNLDPESSLYSFVFMVSRESRLRVATTLEQGIL
jgi:hypothetical protein